MAIGTKTFKDRDNVDVKTYRPWNNQKLLCVRPFGPFSDRFQNVLGVLLILEPFYTVFATFFLCFAVVIVVGGPWGVLCRRNDSTKTQTPA